MFWRFLMCFVLQADSQKAEYTIWWWCPWLVGKTLVVSLRSKAKGTHSPPVLPNDPSWRRKSTGPDANSEDHMIHAFSSDFCCQTIYIIYDNIIIYIYIYWISLFAGDLKSNVRSQLWGTKKKGTRETHGKRSADMSCKQEMCQAKHLILMKL
jgi:hypothetical protein